MIIRHCILPLAHAYENLHKRNPFKLWIGKKKSWIVDIPMFFPIPDLLRDVQNNQNVLVLSLAEYYSSFQSQ